MAGQALIERRLSRRDVLRQRCAEQGRAYESVLRTTLLVPTILAETAAGRQAKLDRLPPQLLGFFEQAGLVASPEEAIDRLKALVAAGFHRHGGAWRERRVVPAKGTERAAPPNEPLEALLERDESGDARALLALREALDADPSIWQRYGDLAALAQASLIALIAGENLRL